MRTQSQKVKAFRELHSEGCFVIPNPWDVGSAVALERMGFKALATTSSGSRGRSGAPTTESAATRRSRISASSPPPSTSR